MPRIWGGFGVVLVLSSLCCEAQAGDIGFRGLNLVPTARHNPVDRVFMSAEYSDPYIHLSTGYQFSEAFGVRLRQSFEVSSLGSEADRVYPGIDFKLRLVEEGAYMPEVSLGMDSAFGHQRMAGEYLALSKRYDDFDMSVGLGWGRFGTADHFRNPLGAVNSHFDNDRDSLSEDPSGPQEWFTGQSVGLFGGVVYQTPVRGVSLSAEYGGDRYVSEVATIDGYKKPSPFSLGMQYRYGEWLDVGLAVQGRDRIYSRVTLSADVSEGLLWGVSGDDPLALYDVRSGEVSVAGMVRDAAAEGLGLFDVEVQRDAQGGARGVRAGLNLREGVESVNQVAGAAVSMARYAGLDVEVMTILPHKYEVSDRAVVVQRRDVEGLFSQRGSVQEVWRNARYDNNVVMKPCRALCYGQMREGMLTRIENKLSLSEDENGILYRSSVITSWRGLVLPQLLIGGDVRLNIAHNLDSGVRFAASRGLILQDKEDYLASNLFWVDRAYARWSSRVLHNFFVAVTGGLLEEQYRGVGAEVLYRPFEGRFAAGLSVYGVQERFPVGLNQGMIKTLGSAVVGHGDVYYEFADKDVTVHAQAGRYLAGDWGGRLSLQKRFYGGARVEGYVSATDLADVDVFGGTTHLSGGLRFVLPFKVMNGDLGRFEVDTRFEPFGRYAGQALDEPMPLYEATEQLSYRQQFLYWEDAFGQ